MQSLASNGAIIQCDIVTVACQQLVKVKYRRSYEFEQYITETVADITARRKFLYSLIDADLVIFDDFLTTSISVEAGKALL